MDKNISEDEKKGIKALLLAMAGKPHKEKGICVTWVDAEGRERYGRLSNDNRPKKGDTQAKIYEGENNILVDINKLTAMGMYD